MPELKGEHANTVPWSDETLVNPHASADKAGRVKSMFGTIARSYDLNNRLHSGWRDQAWRRFAVKSAEVRPGQRVLDVACGTGDLTHAFAKTDADEVVGLDFTAEMLALAEQKRRVLPPTNASKVRYIEGDAQQLPFDSASFDVVSIAFGIRNVADPVRALCEFARVLRPGGRLVVLEFDRPSGQPMRWLYDFYCGSIMPRTATLISGDTSGAYRYLPRSVGTFMSRRQLSDAMRQSGFAQVTDRSLTMGICVCYVAVRS